MTRSDEAKLRVEALEASRAKAIVEADIAQLDRMTDDSYVHVETRGQVRTKAKLLRAFDSAVGCYERYVLVDNLVQDHGDVAVVNGAFENLHRRADGGYSAKTARHTRLYIRRGEE